MIVVPTDKIEALNDKGLAKAIGQPLSYTLGQILSCLEEFILLANMDPVTLTAFLTPFLPFLLKLGNTAADKAAGKFGEDAWAKAKAVWEKLHPKVEAKEAAKEAATDLAATPEDEDLQTALRVQLKKLLDSDAALAEAIAQILQADAPDGTPGTQIVQNVTGNQNQVIGQVTGGKVFGNVTGNVTIDE